MNSTGTDSAVRRHSLLSISKSHAFLIHLTGSALVVGALCALIFFVWYPAPYFAAKGASGVLRILVGVDLILGPTLTLILFRPRKPGLLFDLSIIATIQLAAFLYGGTVIYQERPYYSVFAVDRFEILAYKDVDSSMIEHEELRRKPFIGPILAVASLPEDPDEFQRLLQEILFEGKPDIERRPEFWSPYASRSADVIARSRALAELFETKPEARAEISRLTETLDAGIDSLAYVPLMGRETSLAFVIDAETAAPVDIINVDPWVEEDGYPASPPLHRPSLEARARVRAVAGPRTRRPAASRSTG